MGRFPIDEGEESVFKYIVQKYDLRWHRLLRALQP
jgi:hypothetical protein